MAKKDDIDLDNINLDDFDFDIPEFEDSSPVDDKSRSPVERATKGILKGAKDEIISVSGVRKALSLALPPGYGLAADTIENVASDARSLYDKIGQDQPDLIRGSKSFGRTAMQKVGNRILPKKLADRLNNALEDNDDYKVKSSAEYRKEQEESELAALTEFFRAKGSVEEERDRQDDIQRMEDKALEQVRFKSNIQALTSINRSMARLVGYQDKVTARYQQKMLEISYRHLASTRQLTEMMTESMSKQAAVLEKIRHNTALPEAVKIRGSEMFKQMAHQRLMGSGLNTISNWTANYGKQVMGNITGMMQGIIDPIRDARQMTEGMDIDKYEVGGQAVGSQIGSAIRDYAALNLAPRLAANKTLARTGEKLRNTFTGLPQKINEYAKSETKGTGWRSTMTQMFKDFLPKYQLESSTGIRSVDKLDEMASFDSISRRSLIEIIPGYLSEIAHWTKVAVTGAKDSEKQVYNVVRGGFTSEKEQLVDVGRQIMNRSERESLKKAADDFIKEIGGDTMSGRAQRVLKQKLLDELANGRDLVPARLVLREEYPGEDVGIVDEIVDLIMDAFNINEEGKSLDGSKAAQERFNDIRGKFLDMASMVPAVGDRIRVLSDVLGMDSLRKLGFIERNEKSRQDSINFNKAWSMILDEDDKTNAGGTPKDPAPTPNRPVQRLDGILGDHQDGSSLADRADRADRMGSSGVKGVGRRSWIEKYLGDKSTLITLIRESRDFHSETVELLRQLSGGGIGTGSKVDWGSFVPTFSSGKNKMMAWGRDAATRSTEAYEKAKATAKDIWLQGGDHPLLEEWKLKAGEYKDKATGETLKRWEDIRGDVVDAKGKVIAYYEDLNNNAVVVNAKGKVVKKASDLFGKFKASKAGAMTAEAFSVGQAKMNSVKAAVAAQGGIHGIAGNISTTTKAEARKFKPRLKRIMNFFRGKANDDITSELTGNHEDDMLTLAIRQAQLQYQTLREVTKEKVRKGSYKDIQSKLEDKLTRAKEMAKEKANGVGGLFGKGGMLAGLLGGAAGGDGEGDGEGGGILDTIGDLFGGGTDEDGRTRKDRRRAGRTGRMGKIINAGGRVLDKMGRFGQAVKLGAKATGAAVKGGWWSTKMLGKGAMGAARLAKNLAWNPVTRMAGGFLLRGALSALVGAAGLVSAPVLIGAGVVAGAVAIGAGIYQLTRDKLPPLSALRMAQYGIKPRPDTEEFKLIVELEKLVQQATSVNSDGKASVNINQLDFGEIAKIFKIDLEKPMEENQLAIQTMDYIKGRFAAVYLTHVSNYHALTKSTDLTQVDVKLTGKAALEFLDKVAMKDRSDVFDAMEGPFEDELDMDSGDVEDVYSDSRDTILGSMKDEKAAAAKEAQNGAAGAAVAAGVTAGAGTRIGLQGSKANAAEAATSSKTTPTTSSGDKGSTAKVAANLAAGGVVTGVAASPAMAELAKTLRAKASDYTDRMSVIYRAYGLTEMSEGKAGVLSRLESMLWDQVTYDGDNIASFKDYSGAYRLAEMLFNPVGAEAVDQFYIWFDRRFSPVFLAYCTAVRSIANIDASAAETRLKPQELIEVLKMAVNARDNSGFPIWDISESPWVGYYLNDDAESVKDALYAIQLKVKDKTITETSSTGKGRVRGKDGKLIEEDHTQTNRPASADEDKQSKGSGGGGVDGSKKEEKGFFASAKDTVAGWLGLGDDKEPQNGAAVNPSGPTSLPPSTPITHPGGGSGGNINDIPLPKGDGWGANKETLMAAANMVGVDPTLAASIAGVESGYRPGVKAPTSSAAGYFQVINSTWKSLMGKYASKYGISPNATQYDPRANAVLGLEYIRENIDAVKSKLNRDVTATDVYLAHFLGPGGARRFLPANPADPAVNHVGSDQAAANRSIFYDANGRPRTVAAVYGDFDKKLKKYSQGDAMQVAQTLKGGGALNPAEGVSAATPEAIASATPLPSLSAIKDANYTPSATSANSVTEASAPAGTSNLAEVAENRQVQNTAAPLAVAARSAEAQTSAQTQVSTDTFGGLDKGIGRLIGVNESQLQQLITLVDLIKSGNLQMPTTQGPATELVASAKPTTQNPNLNVPMAAPKGVVSVGRV